MTKTREAALIGQGMAIAAAILMRVWGDEVQAREIMGAAGYKTVSDLKRDGVDDYDIEALTPLLRNGRAFHGS